MAKFALIFSEYLWLQIGEVVDEGDARRPSGRLKAGALYMTRPEYFGR